MIANNHLSTPPLLQADSLAFPDVVEAIAFREGLVAVGGDLSVARLVQAYRRGIFPWFAETDPICWWATAPRMVLLPESLHISRSLQKILRNKHYLVKINTAFEQVMQNCARAARPAQEGTWINQQMLSAYVPLFQQGYAHSFECFVDDVLVGGFYGVWLGDIFFGESMFAYQNDASKIAFAHGAAYLFEQGVKLIDCQMYTKHLARFGAEEVSFTHFSAALKIGCANTLPKTIFGQILYAN